MTTNHEHLRKVAEKVDADIWNYQEINPEDKSWGACEITSGETFIATMVCGVNNANFIATFNPATAIALLDELAALRKENEGLRAKVDGFNSVLKRYQDARVFTNLHTRQVARSISEDAELDAARLIEERPAQGHLPDMPLSDDELPAMWSNADFTGGDQDERCHAARAAIGDSHE